MIGDSATNLVKGIKRDIAFTLPHYNSEMVTKIMNEMTELYLEAQEIMQRSSQSSQDMQDTNLTSLLLFYHLSLKRLKRALLIYHGYRLFYIVRQRSTPLTLLKASESNAAPAQHMTAPETRFVENLTRIRAVFKKTYGESLNLFQGVRRPPRSLYAQIRVVKECGTIQVESGMLSLPKDSVHFVRLKDIEHLIYQGYLEQIFV
jgi:GINS complex subunit 1